MRQIHLVRHGEVHNPDGVIYGRLPGFSLSARGRRMAGLTARHLLERDRTVDHVISSPLDRATQSAEPIAEEFGKPVTTRPGLIEAASRLQGKQAAMSLKILGQPPMWPYLVNPFRPSWGEPYRHVAERMLLELEFARALDGDGDVVFVSHQLPIWMTHRAVTGTGLFHDPRRRRCALSSVTTFEWHDWRWVEVGYADPAQVMPSTDSGAV